MANAFDYPVTTPYGKVAGYPLNNGFHNGVDYGCPAGTPVVVNGVTIGLSGYTGAVYDAQGNRGTPAGAHLHVGRWVGGTVTNPGIGGGATVRGGKVTQVSEDATNGKFVRVADADGSSWVYLHLSKQLVTVGQVLQGGNVATVDSVKADVDYLANEVRPKLDKLREDVDFMAHNRLDAAIDPAIKKLREDVDFMAHNRLDAIVDPELKKLRQDVDYLANEVRPQIAAILKAIQELKK